MIIRGMVSREHLQAFYSQCESFPLLSHRTPQAPVTGFRGSVGTLGHFVFMLGDVDHLTGWRNTGAAAVRSPFAAQQVVNALSPRLLGPQLGNLALPSGAAERSDHLVLIV